MKELDAFLEHIEKHGLLNEAQLTAMRAIAVSSAFVEVAAVTNNNQHGWDNIVTTGPNVTLSVGLKVYAKRTDLPQFTIETLERNAARAQAGEK